MALCDDAYWMGQALLQAQKAFDADEVPVGAVLVHGSELIAAAHNMSVSENDPSAHAEVNVLRQAGQHFHNYRLQGCTLYVTLEPCAMCAMALLHARVDRVVFGARDDKTGAAGSVVDLFANKQHNHQTEV
ncbi:MAG: tRNA adenosine(34) deaminase TadA, partial [Saezia sp.]